MRAILIIREAKYKLSLVYLINSAFSSLINITPTQYRAMHSQAQ